MKACRSTLFAVAAAPVAAFCLYSSASAQQPIVVEAPSDPVITTGPAIVDSDGGVVESDSGQPTIVRPVAPTEPEAVEQPARVPIFDNSGLVSPSEYRRSKPDAAEIRQARALYRERQRIARMERNLWMGHNPLRPQFNAVPMMSSRYAPRRIIYVPVYIPAR